MKKLLIIPIVLLGVGFSSCGNVCIRCENGITAETETKCFTNKDERKEYVRTKEFLGFTCNEN